MSMPSKTTKNTIEKQAYAYTDGGFTQRNGTSVVGYGVVMFYDSMKSKPQIASGCVPNILNQRNVLGELMAAYTAIQSAIAKQCTTITIFHDYTGVAEWAENRWKANNPLTQAYKEAINAFRPKINIQFTKVKGHSGNQWNNEADKAANTAMENFFITGKPDNNHPLIKACLSSPSTPSIASTPQSSTKSFPQWRFGKATPSTTITSNNTHNADINKLIDTAIKQTEDLLATLKAIKQTQPDNASALDMLSIYNDIL